MPLNVRSVRDSQLGGLVGRLAVAATAFGLMAALFLVAIWDHSEDPTPPPIRYRTSPPIAKVPEAALPAAAVSQGYDRLRDQAEGVRAAETFEKLLHAAAPDASLILAFVDIAMADGHLLVYFKAPFNDLEPKLQTSIKASIAQVWRSTKYVADRGWPERVEFIEDRPEDR